MEIVEQWERAERDYRQVAAHLEDIRHLTLDALREQLASIQSMEQELPAEAHMSLDGSIQAMQRLLERERQAEEAFEAYSQAAFLLNEQATTAAQEMLAMLHNVNATLLAPGDTSREHPPRVSRKPRTPPRR